MIRHIRIKKFQNGSLQNHPNCHKSTFIAFLSAKFQKRFEKGTDNFRGFFGRKKYEDEFSRFILIRKYSLISNPGA